eukprot:CAMPEP_0174257002 /NCGR_PEP_ID=MMETSP0439-20130205/6178_1 /TAXON_ID=0 /ORGANISM="Stereomyxa ramosa, Strain Chinc5" /LENGTH=144 /DNA_ID=CAMNT_0015339883 /DNA_START=33 /DNA_END=467 /DNA_ORIENTATION=+
MSTTARASAVIPVDVDTVWAKIRAFDSIADLIDPIASAEMLDGGAPTEVGACRKLTWKSGETRTQRLLELSDINRRCVWETILAEPESEVTAAISTLEATRITEDNSTLLTWSAEYSADVTGDFITFQSKAFAENLKEIRDHLA